MKGPWRLSALFLVALSLSIGWGIRGNFGHEVGAMIPGALAAVAACLVSGREEWRRRVVFFALFGALGWAFGGSMSYGQVIAYAHSGHLPSQLYGFAALGAIGFLWAALGGVGTALPAVLDRERLTALVRPLLWVLGAWFLSDAAVAHLETDLAGVPSSARRHESPLYWFDSDWIAALVALLALGLFDLADRRLAKLPWLLASAAAGAAAGFGLQWSLDQLGLADHLAEVLVRHEGDPAFSGASEAELVINWPQGLPAAGRHLGWVLGAALGVAWHFARHGRFRSGASLYLHMALGWFAGFLLLPVLLGVRMTPPRGDNWAGVLGVLAATLLYFLRRRETALVWVALASGTAGGLGFSGAAWLKLLMVAPGNPGRVEDVAARAAWAHWQSANWHSFLEQTYGFANGLGIAVALGILALRSPPPDDRGPRRRWSEVVAVSLVLLGVTYANLVKCVETWTTPRGTFRAVPETMKAPLFESIELSARSWFTLAYAALAACVTGLLVLSGRRRLALVPATWLGRGQLLYLVFLWWVVVGNFERALVGFEGGRLLTEGVIFLGGVLATALVLLVPREEEPPLRPVRVADAGFRPRLGRTAATCLSAAAAALLLETGTVRLLYGDRHAGHSGLHRRFGPEATWRIAPLVRGREHR